MEDIEDEDADTYRDIVRDPLRHGAAGYNLAPVCRPKSPPKVGRVVHSSNRFLISVWRRFFCFGGLMYTDATRKTGGFAMFVLTNRLIIALAAVSSALLMAIVALWFPAWAHSHAPTLNLIPGIWRPHPEPEMVRWTTYVIGAGELGGFIATMIIHGKLPVKQAAAIFCAAAVLGTLSWWNPFLVVAGIWLVFATMYATKRFDTENLARTANREPFVLGRARWEAAAWILIGAAFSMGIKYGFGLAILPGVVFPAWMFVMPVGVAEVIYALQKASLKECS